MEDLGTRPLYDNFSTLQCSFSPFLVQPASYCTNYPIMNYTLEVNSSLNQEILASALEPIARYITLGGNLSNENTLYTFRVVVNDVGIAATKDRQFCKSFSFITIRHTHCEIWAKSDSSWYVTILLTILKIQAITIPILRFF